MINNMIVSYVDARTGALLAEEEFYDPDVKWIIGKNLRLYTSWGCGRPLPWWLAKNPPPRSK